jgi:hypothetical protein
MRIEMDVGRARRSRMQQQIHGRRGAPFQVAF